MNKTQILFGAALISGVLAASAPSFASTSITGYADRYKALRTDVPLPTKVVNPTDVPGQYAGSTVTLQLTVDAAGAARNISVVSPNDPELSRAVVKAVSQWRFAPARKGGVPVESRIELPLQLKDTRQMAGLTLADPAGW
jgi:TonB family protein